MELAKPRRPDECMAGHTRFCAEGTPTATAEEGTEAIAQERALRSCGLYGGLLHKPT